MGIPLFREPEQVPTVSAAEKLDHAASVSRRTIRRQPTFRPYRERAAREANNAPLSNESFANYRYRMRQAERASRPRSERGEVSHDFSWNASSIDLHANPERVQAGEELLRDALQHERPGERLRRRREPRESALRFEVAPSDAQQNQSERFSTTPSSTSGTTPPLTVGFAPAFPVGSGASRQRGASASELPRIPTPPGQSWTASYPPLHRTRASERSPEDGNSSDSDMEENHWETLLTTIEPDEHLPSATSSFVSATASFSTSRSGPASQSTAPSSVEPQVQAETTADSTYCPHSPYDSDGASGDDHRTPAPPLELIQRMNRRAEAAARSRDWRRGDDRYVYSTSPGWRTHRQPPPLPNSSHEGQSPLDSENGIFIPEQRTSNTTLTQHSNNSNAHLPVVFSGELRVIPRPVDGPLETATGDASAATVSALDNEIEQEIQRATTQALADITRDEASSRETQRNLHLPPLRNRGPSRMATATEIPETLVSDSDVETSDLPLMQRVIQRMARREDIPDDWWASVGLRRSFDV